jgi:hypothetical protein
MTEREWLASMPSRRIEAIGTLILLLSTGLYAAVAYFDSFGQDILKMYPAGLLTELMNALASDDPRCYLRGSGFPLPRQSIDEYFAGFTRTTEVIKRMEVYQTLRLSSVITFIMGSLLIFWGKWRH